MMTERAVLIPLLYLQLLGMNASSFCPATAEACISARTGPLTWAYGPSSGQDRNRSRGDVKGPVRPQAGARATDCSCRPDTKWPAGRGDDRLSRHGRGPRRTVHSDAWDAQAGTDPVADLFRQGARLVGRDDGVLRGRAGRR